MIMQSRRFRLKDFESTRLLMPGMKRYLLDNRKMSFEDYRAGSNDDRVSLKHDYEIYLEQLKKDAQKIAKENPFLASRNKDPLIRYFSAVELSRILDSYSKDLVFRMTQDHTTRNNIAFLLMLSKDPRYIVRAIARNALVLIYRQEKEPAIRDLAVNTLLDSVRTDKSMVARLFSLSALSEIVLTDRDIAIRILKTLRKILPEQTHPYVILQILEFFKRYGSVSPEYFLSDLDEYLRYSDKDVRGCVVELFAKYRPLQGVDIVKRYIKDRSVIVRQRTIRAIGILLNLDINVNEKQELKEMLRGILENNLENKYVREEAKIVLSQNQL